MQGVTTALVGFLFVCVVFPNLVRNRPQYYAALGLVCLIILLDAIGVAISPTEVKAFRVFAYAACAFLQVGAILLLMLACGGVSWRQMAGDMKQALEVIRRGGEEKEIIIPLSGEMARMKAQRNSERERDQGEESSPQRIVIDDPAAAPSPPVSPDERPPER